MVEQSLEKSPNKIRVVTNVLTKALKLWLKTQVKSVSHLEVEIRASDRQILSGCVPWVSICAQNAVYQGIHLTNIQLVAENIRINIGSVLKGQPLRLLEKVPVVAELSQAESDLNASLESEILATGLNDVLVKLLPELSQKSKSITIEKVKLAQNQAVLYATVSSEHGTTSQEIGVGLDLLSGCELQLNLIQAKSDTVTLSVGDRHQHYINLGSDVDIEHLTLLPKKLECRGRININP